MARSADPVRELMHRHRELCALAVDPLEIAAALEAEGVTDRDAARFRHRDVFSLAEELYARAPGSASVPSGSGVRERRGGPGGGARLRLRRALLPVLPGALCAVTLGLLTAYRGQAPYERVAVGVLGAGAVVGAVWLVLRCVLRVRPTAPLALGACWLAGWALAGDRLLAAVSGDGDAASVPLATPVPLVLACAVAPAVWGARWFAVRARRGLAGSRGLGRFAAGVRPSLAGLVLVFVSVLLGLGGAVDFAARPGSPASGATALGLTASGSTALDAPALKAPALDAAALGPTVLGTTALGLLLLLALLLTAHGCSRAATAGLAAACLLQAVAPATAFAGRLLPLPASPYRVVETAVTQPGPGGLTGACACGCAVLFLLPYAFRLLCRASAHRREPAP